MWEMGDLTARACISFLIVSMTILSDRSAVPPASAELKSSECQVKERTKQR